MHQSFNIVGRLGRDPELKYNENALAICNFSVAVNGFKGGAKTTMWVRVSVFGKRAETCNKYLAKGSIVGLEGELTFDVSTGNPRVYNEKASFEMVANKVNFIDGIAKPEPVAPEDEELPF